MSKIGLLTLNGYFNYGNRLQNLATQEVLKSLGFSVETIIVRNSTKKVENITFQKRLKSLVKKTPIEAMGRIYYKTWQLKHSKDIEKWDENRTTIFKKFTSDNIVETIFFISDTYSPNEYLDQYDYFITGSDQVWNPHMKSGSEIYFLPFASKSKRIAFSPSFGVAKIPEEDQLNYSKWLSEMNCLSVREYEGAQIIKELTGREALVLVDPTMLLNKEQWLSFSKKPNNLTDEKYLLTYFLGGTPNEYKSKIRKIAKDNNLCVINLSDIREFDTYQTGPAEFIEYINSASIFCTDSFHGCVFAVLMETPFIVFERKGYDGVAESMFSRIETFLNKFLLQSRKFSNITIDDQLLNCDYSHIHEILEGERKKALEFLKSALEIKG